MWAVGLKKTAALSTHNDGSEFKINDTDPAPYAAGGAGSAPSGIPTYKPVETSKPGKGLETSKQLKNRAVSIAMLSKMADQPRDTGLDGTESPGDGVSTLVTQLKYEKTHNDIDAGRKNLPDGKGKKKMSLVAGMKKTAVNWGNVAEKGLKGAQTVLKGAKDVGTGALSGLRSAGNVALKEHVTPSGIAKHVGGIGEAAKANGGFANSFKSQSGRQAMGTAIGKAAPSLAAGAGYAAAGKKLYDKTFGSSTSQNQQYYY